MHRRSFVLEALMFGSKLRDLVKRIKSRLADVVEGAADALLPQPQPQPIPVRVRAIRRPVAD
jgi:hypothetical protein